MIENSKCKDINHYSLPFSIVIFLKHIRQWFHQLEWLPITKISIADKSNDLLFHPSQSRCVFWILLLTKEMTLMSSSPLKIRGKDRHKLLLHVCQWTRFFFLSSSGVSIVLMIIFIRFILTNSRPWLPTSYYRGFVSRQLKVKHLWRLLYLPL